MAVREVNNLTIEKGTDFDETLFVYEDDGSPVGINTSFSGISKLRKYPDAEKEYSFQVELNAEESSVRISMASSITSTLPSGRCYFDVILSHGNVDIITKKYIKGTMIVHDTSSL